MYVLYYCQKSQNYLSAAHMTFLSTDQIKIKSCKEAPANAEISQFRQTSYLYDFLWLFKKKLFSLYSFNKNTLHIFDSIGVDNIFSR